MSSSGIASLTISKMLWQQVPKNLIIYGPSSIFFSLILYQAKKNCCLPQFTVFLADLSTVE